MFVRRGALAGFLSILLTAGSAAGAPAALAGKIDSDVETALHRFEVPGAAVMVVRNGNVAFVRAYGTRDVAGGQPVRPDTFFEIGSITKQFTAACILQLQEA